MARLHSLVLIHGIHVLICRALTFSFIAYRCITWKGKKENLSPPKNILINITQQRKKEKSLQHVEEIIKMQEHITEHFPNYIRIQTYFSIGMHEL